ncbi:MAG: tetratricopeptide repeat protein [Candidatus Accumulibacter sp. UW20]|jgi:tetratricopeptide (TPR) repeat protein
MKCPLCEERKGKRLCKVNAGQFICPLCCAATRGAGCEGCRHYEPCLAYQREKDLVKASVNKHFTVEVLQEVDDRCDDALLLAEKGELSRAAAAIETIRRQYPEYHTVLYAMGVIHALRDEMDEAIPLLQRAVEIFPVFAHAHYNLGEAFCRKALLEPAVLAFQSAIAVDGERGPVGRLAKEKLDKLEAIVKTGGISLATYMESSRTFDRAFDALREKRFQTAIDLFSKVLKTTPNHVQSYGNMGLAYAGLGNRQKAFECLDRAIALDPEYAPAITNRRLIASLPEGETLSSGEMQEISYYSDRSRSTKDRLLR